MPIYESSVTNFIHFLRALSAIVKKAKAHCAQRGISDEVLLGCRLFPDMLPLSKQIQISTDAARRAGARLTGLPEASVADTEKTFDELLTRIDSTIFFLNTLKKEDFDPERPINFKMGGREMSFTSQAYLDMWAKPNFFFHMATAYALFRHNGLEVGKMDFLGLA